MIDRAKCAMIVTEYPTEICEALSNTFGSCVTHVDATGAIQKRLNPLFILYSQPIPSESNERTSS